MADKLDLAALERASRPKERAKPAPITNPRVALELLSKDDTTLDNYPTRDPEICRWDYEAVPVELECFLTLRDEGWILGKPMWGHSHQYEYVMTPAGYRQCRAWDKEDTRKAHIIILKEGKLPQEVWCHTFFDYGRRRKHWEDTRDGVYLVNPQGEGFIIYVDTEEVVRHDESPFVPRGPTPSQYTLLGLTWFHGEQGIHMKNLETGKEIIFFPDRETFRTFDPEK